MAAPEAGWYPDGQGATRWWDGTAWTEHVQPTEGAAARPVEQAPVPGTGSVPTAATGPGAGLVDRLRAEATAGAQPRDAHPGMSYVVLQVVLREKLLGTGSGNLTELERAINAQAAKGYRLHTISTTASGSKGLGGGDRVQATMVFEKLV